MKINKLIIEDFRSIHSGEIDCTKPVVLHGKNGAGKSSVLAAVETVLTGKNQYTDGKVGQKMKINDLIQDGAKAAEITLVGKNIIKKRITKTSQKLLAKGASIKHDVMLQSLQVTPEQVRAACRSGEFFEMSEKVQKAVLLDVCGSDYEKSEIIEKAVDWAKEFLEDETQKVKFIKAVEAMWKSYGFSDQVGADEIQNIYKAAYQIRKTANELHDKISSETEALNANLKKVSSIQVEPQILQDKINASRKKITEAKVLIREHEKNALRISEQSETAKKCINEIEKLEGELEKSDIDDNHGVKDFNEDIETLQKKITDTISEKITPKKIKVKELQKIITSWEENGVANISCPFAKGCDRISGEEFKKHIETIKESKSIIENTMQVDQNYIDISNKELGALKTKKTDFEKNFKKIEKIKQDIKVHKSTLEVLDKTTKSEVKPPMTEEEIEKCEKEIVEISEQLRVSKGYNDMKLKYEESKEKEQKRSEYCHYTDIIVKAFDKKGIIATLINDNVDPVRSKIEDRFRQIMGADWDIKTGGGEKWEITLLHFGYERKVASLSTGEKTALSIAIQDAITHAVGLRLLMLDNIEVLDKNARVNIKNILQNADDYENIFIAVCDETPFENANNYVIENGIIKGITCDGQESN